MANCRGTPAEGQIVVCGSHVTWALNPENDGQPCDASVDPEERFAPAMANRQSDEAKGAGSDWSFSVTTEGPWGSGRYWTITVVRDDTGGGVCLQESTAGFRSLASSKAVGQLLPLRWVADLNADGRDELILWGGFPLSEHSNDSRFGLLPRVYVATATGFVRDEALTRIEMKKVAEVYRQAAAEGDSELRLALASRLDDLANEVSHAETSFQGKARNAKLSAAVVRDGQAAYCLDRQTWAAEIVGARVMVTGSFERTEHGAPVARKCRSWLARPTGDAADTLPDWIRKNAQTSDGMRRRFRLPVIVSFTDSTRLAIRGGVVRLSQSDVDNVAFTLDDTALGVSLIERLRQHCPETEATCAIWLEGYWGPLLTRPIGPPGGAERDTFSVLAVLTPLDEPELRRSDAFVEIP